MDVKKFMPAVIKIKKKFLSQTMLSGGLVRFKLIYDIKMIFKNTPFFGQITFSVEMENLGFE